MVVFDVTAGAFGFCFNTSSRTFMSDFVLAFTTFSVGFMLTGLLLPVPVQSVNRIAIANAA
jgi:hypothetical protein